MIYALVVLLAVVFTFLGFASECAAGNIIHVKNGREPNAGAAIFPGIPFIPIIAFVIVRLLNRLIANLGFSIFFLSFVLYLPFWWVDLRRMNEELANLTAATEDSRESNADEPPSL